MVRPLARAVAYQDVGQQPILAGLVVHACCTLTCKVACRPYWSRDQLLPGASRVVGPPLQSWQPLALFAAGAAFAAGWRRRLVEHALRMNLGIRSTLAGK